MCALEFRNHFKTLAKLHFNEHVSRKSKPTCLTTSPGALNNF